MKSGIYMWTSPSGKSYIGQATDLNKRKNEFIRFSNRYAGTKIENARRKYNDIQYWTYTILERCDIDALDKREVYYINYYGTVENGYNCESGGGTNKHHCEETKRKISEAMNGKNCGVNNPMWGKHHSEEIKQKIGEASKGKRLTEETKRKLSELRKGKYCDENSPLARAVIQYTKDGQFIAEYPTAKQAAQLLSTYGCHITACCRGKRKSAGGYIWKYKKEND